MKYFLNNILRNQNLNPKVFAETVILLAKTFQLNTGKSAS